MALIASFVVGRRKGLTFVMYSSLLSNVSIFPTYHTAAHKMFSAREDGIKHSGSYFELHPLVHESWSKIGIEIRQILFILGKKICHQFPTKFCQGLPNFNTPSSCLGAVQIFVRHEIWQICQFTRHDWRKMSIKKILSILLVRVF